jgi:hypothetical protein
VGMGWSGKSPSKAYRFVDHVRYIDAWLDVLQLTKNVTLIGHDWGDLSASFAPGAIQTRSKPSPILRRSFFRADGRTIQMAADGSLPGSVSRPR